MSKQSAINDLLAVNQVIATMALSVEDNHIDVAIEEGVPTTIVHLAEMITLLGAAVVEDNEDAVKWADDVRCAANNIILTIIAMAHKRTD